MKPAIDRSLQQYLDLKEKADDLRRDAEKSAGALELLEKKLKEEFDCKSLKEAQLLLERMEQDQERAEMEFSRAADEFKDAWEKQWSGPGEK